MTTDDTETIAAISTPIGFGGIGIVRLSGSGCIDIARKIFRRTAPKVTTHKKAGSDRKTQDIIPRRLNYGYLVDGENKTIFYEVLMAYMPSPNSYTREDVIEIQSHGGTASLNAILELVIRNGARLADPGEFTRRAYLNGRIDLSQAEAIIDVIQAKTDASLRISNRNLEGDVGKAVREMRKGLLDLKVMLEACIDFPEEVGEKLDEKEIRRKIEKEFLEPLKTVLEGYRHGHLVREGVRLVIIGRTNVGKSSLLNRFLQRERAIVTSYPGTTRDSLEESISLFGLPTVVVDTAGWRNTNDPIEKIGIERTLEFAQNANLILFMVDASTGVVSDDDDIYSRIHKKEKIIVINKKDLLGCDKRVSIPEHWRFSDVLYTSAKFGQGFESMRERIYKCLMRCGKMYEAEVVPNFRQKNLFKRAQRRINGTLKGLNNQIHPELIAIDIQEAMDALDEITGANVKPKILDEIFNRFCIGK